MPDPTTAIIAGGATILAGGIGYLGERQASREARRAGDAATQAELEMFYTSRKDLEPWRLVGSEALWSAFNLAREFPKPEDVREQPGYQFRVGEGVRAIQSTAAARGKRLSGETLRDVQTFGQQEAELGYDRDVQRWLSRLTPMIQLAGLGGSTSQAAAGLASATGGRLAGIEMDVGGAQASGYRGQYGALSDVVSRLGEGALLYGEDPGWRRRTS